MTICQWQKSGLKPGDIILQLGGTNVRNIRFYNLAWRRLAAQELFFAGDTVEILVQRDEEELTSK